MPNAFFDFNPARYTILIVDDNPTNIGVLTDYLKADGFTILSARDGETGLKRAAYALPDIILLDVMMPGIDGFEACRQLKSNPKTQAIPVIFMTALANVEDKVKGFQAGAVDYVTKPIQQEEVLARVTTHLRLRDLTTELQEKNRQLEELNASKDRFFSIVAHDLKSPFNPLLGLALLLAQTPDQTSLAEIRQMAEGIYKSAHNVHSLLENLLTWARAESGRMKYAPERLNLREIAQQSLELLAENATVKQVTLHNELSECWVMADPEMLDSVFRNLIANALKFTSAGGSVRLTARADHAQIEIAIADTGVGIEPHNLARLFRLDEHLTTRGTAEEGGTGLGLVICKDMIERHGGRIWAESEAGRGTTVRFTLPQAT